MKLNPKTLQAYNLFHKGALALAKAERQGIRLDLDYCTKATQELSDEIIKIEKELDETDFIKEWRKIQGSKFNLYSSNQLGKYLYDTLKYKAIKKTATGKGSTDNEALTALNIPEIKKYLRIKKLKKVRDTYLTGFTREAVDGMIHASFNLHNITTFRSGSSSPNLQNISKNDPETSKIIRSALFPRKGHQLMEVDYSQIEVRVGAAIHKDPSMISYIKNPGTDMHRDTCVDIFKIPKWDSKSKYYKKLRGITKGFVFSQFYGDYYVQCAENLARNCQLPKGIWKENTGIMIDENTHLSNHLIEQGITCYQEFENHLKEVEDIFWNVRFKIYTAWKKKTWNKYQKAGYIDMKTGFRCKGTMNRNEALNREIQGSSFHCLLWSFIRLTEIAEEEKWDTKLIAQIHDAIVFDVNPDELEHVLKTTKKVMCEDLKKHFKWINVPIDVEAEISPIDGSWYEVEGIKI